MTSGKHLHKPASPLVSETVMAHAAPVVPTVAAAAGLKTEPRPAAPDPQAIAARAYEYWLERGCVHGSAEEDWLRAEKELAAR